jgi:PAS domain S-box-containing protein
MLEHLKITLLSEFAPESILIIDSASKIMYVNNSFEQLFGYTRQEAIGSDLSIIQPKELAGMHIVGLTRYLKTRQKKLNWQSTRTRGISKTNTEFPIEISFSHVRLDDADYFAAFIKDITEVVAQENRINQQNEELKKKNEELDNFAYRVSHDLRAPLLSVLGLVNVYRISPDKDQHSFIIDNIEKSIKKLDLYIREIIDLSKNGRIEPQLTEVNMVDLIQETFEALHYMEAFSTIEKQVKINLSEPILADAFRLKIICMNLVSNAIRYHNRRIENPMVTIQVEKNGGFVHLQVADNGIGMSAETLTRVFEMYYRGSDLSNGSGLGMYIVKEMASRIGGQVNVQSELGVGTTIEILFPLLESSK